jgi:hypothetical protein
MHSKSVSMLVCKDVFWHDFDNISNFHDIKHAYIISSRIEILFLSRYGNHLKRNEVRHDLKHYIYLDMLESISNNVYSHVKILFDMIKKTFQIDTWLDMLW